MHPNQIRMAYQHQTKVTIAADTICQQTGARLTTIQIIGFWKILLQELERHRVFSLCVGSSRAVPSHKFRQQVLTDPFVPLHWGRKAKGMQATSELRGWRLAVCYHAWMILRLAAVFASYVMDKIGLHKQVCNRVLEPWLKVDLVLSSTEWWNFLSLRDHKDAQPEIQVVARLIYDAIQGSTATLAKPGDLHLPLMSKAEIDRLNAEGKDPRVVSAARCARASYQHWAGKTYEEDVELVARLTDAVPQHLSPFEHVATVANTRGLRSGNFVGFIQWREELQPTLKQTKREYLSRKTGLKCGGDCRFPACDSATCASKFAP